MDEQLINKIKGVKIDWDKEALWEELEPQLPTPKRRFPWRDILLVCISLLAMVYCGRENIASLHETQASSTSSDKNTPQDALANLSTSTEKRASQISTHPEHLVQGGFGQQHLEKENEDAATLRAGTEIVPLASPQVISPNTEATNIQQPNPLTAAARPIENNFITPSTNDIDYSADVSKTAITSISLIPPTPNQNKQVELVQKAEETLLPQEQITENQLASASTTYAVQNPRQVSGRINTLPPSPFAGVVSTGKKSIGLISITASEQKIADKGETGFFVDLSSGIGTLNRSAIVNSTDATESTILLANKDLEETQFNLLVDLGIGYQLRNGFFLKSGLHYSEKHEQLNWEGESNVDTLKNFNERAYYSLNEFGDTIFYGGQSDFIKTSQRQLRHWNRLRAYDLPLELGYSTYHNKLNFQASLGLVLNLSRQFSGRVIESVDQVVDNPAIGISKKMGYTAAIGVGYQITGRYQLFANGSYRRSPTFHISSVEQSYQSLNVQLGIRAFLKN